MTDIGTDRGGDGLCGREMGQEVLGLHTDAHTKSVVTPT